LASRHLAEAETAFKAALPLAERLRPRDERLTRTVARLGMVYAVQNKWDEGQRYMQKHADLCAEIFGAESSQSADSTGRIGGDWQLQRKDYPTARNSYLRAIEMEDKLLGPNDPRVMMNLSRLGSVYVAQGDYAQAEPIFLHALELAESVSATQGVVGEGYLVPLQNLYIAGESSIRRRFTHGRFWRRANGNMARTVR
jgi:tetratricopeptide (TPR) repeat protein